MARKRFRFGGLDPIPGEEIPDDAPRWQREHFIPVQRHVLTRLIAERPELTPDESEQFRLFANRLAATFHFRNYESLEKIKETYAPLNPDAEWDQREQITEDQREQKAEELFALVVSVLKRANYQRLTRRQLEQAVEEASHWGVRLDLDFKAFRKLEMFARGDVVGSRSKRNWRKYYRHEDVDVPIYRRLLVMFQLQEHRWVDKGTDLDSVYIKLFKNIPQVDIDMLLPAARVRMSLLDQGKIIFPTLTGTVLTAIKIVKGAFLAITGGLLGMLAFVGLVGGTVGYGIKSFFGYLRTKDKYQLSLTRNLYFQNLGSNLGVLFRVLHEAEEQDWREVIVAYFMLWKIAPKVTPAELDRRTEKLLEEMLSVDVDFETHDAVDKLLQMGLATLQVDGTLSVLPLDEALDRINQVSPAHH